MTTLSYRPEMIFQKTDKWNFGEITVTPRLLKILAEINGRNSLAVIADDCQLSFDEVVEEIKRLERFDIIKGLLPPQRLEGSEEMSLQQGYLEPDYDLMVEM